MKIETKYELRQTVWLNELRSPAKIVGLFIGLNKELQYECRWFNDHNAKNAYFYEDELGIPPESEIGFNTKPNASH